MSCKIETPAPLECKAVYPKWKYVIAMSDCKFDKDGNFIGLKRKYGKFTRPVYKL
jgi:hypothetical protein